MAVTVTAIIPTWNRRDLLRDVLTDLASQSFPLTETLVIDNGSTDGAPSLAYQMGARILTQPANTGFAPAVNRGIREARTSHVAILNNDIRLDPRCLEHLVQHAADHAFVAPKIRTVADPTLLDGSFDLLSRGATAWRAGNHQPDGPLWDQPRAIQFVPFTAVLFRRDVFDQIGYLEEAFESYLEDIDFGLRCALAGLHGWYEPQALASHYGSATLGRWNPQTVRRISRNQLWLAKRHYSARYAWPIAIGQLLWGALALRHGTFFSWLEGKRQAIAQTCPAPLTPTDPAKLHRILTDSEAILRTLQQQHGWDLYWRLYCALT